MKRLTVGRIGLAAILGATALAVGAISNAAAGTLYWASNGSSQGGEGAWNTTSSQWYNGSSYTTWSDGNEADFTTTGGTVLNTDDRTVGGLVFTTGGYTLGAAGTTGVITTGGGNAIHVSAGSGMTTIYSPLALSSAGTITNAAGSSLLIGGALNAGGNALKIASDGSTTIAGNLSISNAAVTNAGNGTLTLTGTNTFHSTSGIALTTLAATSGTLVVSGGSTSFTSNTAG